MSPRNHDNAASRSEPGRRSYPASFRAELTVEIDAVTTHSEDYRVERIGR